MSSTNSTDTYPWRAGHLAPVAGSETSWLTSHATEAEAREASVHHASEHGGISVFGRDPRASYAAAMRGVDERALRNRMRQVEREDGPIWPRS